MILVISRLWFAFQSNKSLKTTGCKFHILSQLKVSLTSSLKEKKMESNDLKSFVERVT